MKILAGTRGFICVHPAFDIFHYLAKNQKGRQSADAAAVKGEHAGYKRFRHGSEGAL